MKLIDDDRSGGSLASCEICKVRRIRCDRKLPKCTRCVKKGLECKYPKRGLNKENSQWNKGVMKFDTKPKVSADSIQAHLNEEEEENENGKQLVLSKPLRNIQKPITLKLCEGIKIQVSLPKMNEILRGEPFPPRDSKFTVPDPGAPPIVELGDFFRNVPINSIIMKDLDKVETILNPSQVTKSYLLTLYFSQFHIVNPYFPKLEFLKRLSIQSDTILHAIYFGAYFVYPNYNKPLDDKLCNEMISIIKKSIWKPSIKSITTSLIIMRSLLHRGRLYDIQYILKLIRPALDILGFPNNPYCKSDQLKYTFELLSNGLFELDIVVAMLLHKPLILTLDKILNSNVNVKAKIILQLDPRENLSNPLNQLKAYCSVIYKDHHLRSILPVWHHLYQLKRFNVIFATNAKIRATVRGQLLQILERMQLHLINQINKFDNLMGFENKEVKCKKDEIILWFLWIIHWSKAMLPPEKTSIEVAIHKPSIS